MSYSKRFAEKRFLLGHDLKELIRGRIRDADSEMIETIVEDFITDNIAISSKEKAEIKAFCEYINAHIAMGFSVSLEDSETEFVKAEIHNERVWPDHAIRLYRGDGAYQLIPYTCKELCIDG